jgi:hypothetical protein
MLKETVKNIALILFTIIVTYNIIINTLIIEQIDGYYYVTDIFNMVNVYK